MEIVRERVAAFYADVALAVSQISPVIVQTEAAKSETVVYVTKPVVPAKDKSPSPSSSDEKFELVFICPLT